MLPENLPYDVIIGQNFMKYLQFYVLYLDGVVVWDSVRPTMQKNQNRIDICDTKPVSLLNIHQKNKVLKNPLSVLLDTVAR